MALATYVIIETLQGVGFLASYGGNTPNLANFFSPNPQLMYCSLKKHNIPHGFREIRVVWLSPRKYLLLFLCWVFYPL